MATANLPLTLVDWLDDLSVRFLLNLPSTELSSVPRLCFQVEEAQWYYEDFIRPYISTLPHTAPLPSLTLRQFCLLLFQHCPLLSGFTGEQHIAAYEEFLAYKVRVPVRGAILVDQAMERVVLVRGWKKGSSWSFPRGKINKDERDLDCAIREVYEETGYDISTSGLLPENYNYEDEVGEESKIKYIDITMREQHIRLFVFRGVPLDTHFETKTRKEISKIAWYDISSLPGFTKHNHNHAQNQKQPKHHPSETEQPSQASKFYMVAPFLGPLKKWIHAQRKKDALEAKQHRQRRRERESGEFATGTEEDTEDQGRDVDVGKEEALRRLVGVGGAGSTSAPTERGEDKGAGAGDLLAMLRGAPPVDLSSNDAQSLQHGGIVSNGANLPHTPFEQINAIPPQEPDTPQPQHLRQPSVGAFQQHPQTAFHAPPPPQFPVSPQGMPQQNIPLPTPTIFGQPQPQFRHNQGPHFQPQHPGIPPFSQPPPQQQQLPSRPNMSNPPYPSAPYPSGPQNDFPFQPQPQRQPNMQAPPSLVSPPPFQGVPPQNAPFMAPTHSPAPLGGPRGAIASGPIGGPLVPSASQLPPPPGRLNAHTARLLDAFKGGPGKSLANTSGDNVAASAAVAQVRPSSSTPHQAALLDLFKKSSPAPTVEMEEKMEAEAEAPLSPALTDVTEKPKMERKPTLNEITRTLGPVKTKSKKMSGVQSPVSNEAPSSTEPAHNVQPTVPESSKAAEKQLFDPHEGVMKPVTPRSTRDAASLRERPKSRGIFDPNDRSTQATKPAPTFSNVKPEAQDLSPASSSPVRKILQRPASKQGSRSPTLHKQSLAPTSSSPVRDGAAAPTPSQSHNTGSRPSSFTILTRPGSSRGGQGQKSPGLPVTPTSPAVRDESAGETMLTPKSAWQPQVLKRPKEGDGDAVDAEKNGGEGRTEQLLKLFGKSSVATSSGAQTQTQLPPAAGDGTVRDAQRQAGTETGKRNANANALLDLFNTKNSVGSSGSSLKPQDPPPAPKLSPSPSGRKVSPAPAPSATAPNPTNTATQSTNPPPPTKSQQNLLLDLFNKPSTSTSTSASTLTSTNTALNLNVNSPNTPISPFTLGTPATNVPASVGTSVAGEDIAGGKGSEKDRAKEKEFLMGYLDGVVRGEGFRGAGWG